MASKNSPKGLEHLFKGTGNIKKIASLTEMTRSQGDRKKLNIELLIPNPYQPRTKFDEKSLKELSDSIKQHGIIQPIVVRRAKKDTLYEIIAGERRVKAAKLAGLQEIDVLVKTWDDKTTRQMTLLENIQREDLNQLEIAKSYMGLKQELNLTQDELSKLVSKSRSAVANFLRLLELPSITKKLIENNTISGSFARTLMGLKNNDLIETWSMDENIQKLSVAELEKKVKQFNEPKKPKKYVEKDNHLITLENKISEELDTVAKIGPTLEKGKIEIKYNSKEELIKIIESIWDFDI